MQSHFSTLRKNGTGPFTSHKCVIEYNAAIKEAEKLADNADKQAVEAAAKAESAKRAVEQLRKSPSKLNEKNATNIEDSDSSASHTDANPKDSFEAKLSKTPILIDSDSSSNDGRESSIPNERSNKSIKNSGTQTSIEPCLIGCNLERQPHAEIVANAIEYFVIIAIEGRPVKAADIIDHIPVDFIFSSW